MLAKDVWWEQVRRAAKRQGPAGSKAMSDWSHDMIEVSSATENSLELVGPWGHRRHQPIPAERCTEEYKRRETRRLIDELGVTLGVGPMP